MKKAVIAAIMLTSMVAGSAHAVGDPPRRLSAREAANLYRSVRPLLGNDGQTCPAGQLPLSATVTGGAAARTGSRTTTILFDKGARVVIGRTWDHAEPSAAVSITCSQGRMAT